MRTSLRSAVTRRSVLLAFLSPLRPQPSRPQAARMTPMGEAWSRFFLWTGLSPSPGLPAAA